MEDNYKNAYAEVYYIIKNYNKNSVDKISAEFIEYVKDNYNKDYDVNIDINKPLDAQNLLYETKVVLAWMYQEFFATDEEKKIFLKQNLAIEKEEEYKKKEIFKEKEGLFDKKIQDIGEKLPKERKKSIFKMILDKIQKFLRG